MLTSLLDGYIFFITICMCYTHSIRVCITCVRSSAPQSNFLIDFPQVCNLENTQGAVLIKYNPC